MMRFRCSRATFSRCPRLSNALPYGSRTANLRKRRSFPTRVSAASGGRSPMPANPRSCARCDSLRGWSGTFRSKSVSDHTLTIGHLDPMRPPYHCYNNPVWQSPLPFGTTSELVINNTIGHPTLYKYAGSAYFSECAVVDHWLWKARHNPSLAPFEGWDSGYSHIRRDHQVAPDKDTPNVTPIRPRPTDNGHLEIQFRQYLL